ncbi:hypothetical protein ACFVAO_13390 [Streptomyces californicus]|uniref:hypothetical protein n=1 Tax=Streptomyces californicus TaxID=67351 RepID=UPI0036BA9443
MGMSELKAALADAYANSAEPKFLSVAENGDELWSMGSAMFVLPAVPAGAPPEMEYALRVRRAAVLSGTCDECNASLNADPFGRLEGVEAVAAIIPHRRNCPASDENLLPQLQRFREHRKSTSTEDIFAAASRATRLSVEAKTPLRRMIRNRKFESWVRRLLDQKLAESTGECGHLHVDPAQTWNILLGDTEWKCDQCWEYQGLEIIRGNSPISTQEDFTCDHCRTVKDELEPLILRVGTFVLHGGLCRTCSKRSMETTEKPRRKKNGAKRRGRR